MAFMYELKNSPMRNIKTGLIGLLFIGLGIFTSALGPALLDLQQLANTTISEIAFLLPVRAFGYAIGSMIAGILALGPALLDLQLLADTTISHIVYLLPCRALGFVIGSVIAGVLGDIIDHQPIIIGSTILTMVTMFLFPLIPNIYAMYALIGLSGISNGCIDCIGNCWIIHIWGKENPPFMQILHFMYGVGALIAPFLVEPFLLNKETFDDVTLNYTENSTLDKNVGTSDELMIHWPFIIGSIFYLVILTLFVLNYVLNPKNPVHPSRTAKTNSKEVDEEHTKVDKFQLNNPLTGNIKILVIVVASLCMHAYVGVEISFGSLLSPFAVKSDLNLSKSQGSFITGCYWSTYTFLRIFSLILIIYVSPRTLLIGNFLIIMLSNCILVPFANNYEWALWLGSALMGFGCSSVFATMFGFVEQLTPITARITAGFMIAACAGEFVIPMVVSRYLESWPPIFLWTVLIYSTVSFACVIGLAHLQYKLLRKQKSKQIINEKNVDILKK